MRIAIEDHYLPTDELKREAHTDLADWWEQKDASFCLQCNECVPKCPTKLNIPELLKETHNLLVDKPKKRLWS